VAKALEESNDIRKQRQEKASMQLKMSNYDMDSKGSNIQQFGGSTRITSQSKRASTLSLPGVVKRSVYGIGNSMVSLNSDPFDLNEGIPHSSLLTTFNSSMISLQSFNLPS
jgi:hypothetical protein